jgi:hypothetical protein
VGSRALWALIVVTLGKKGVARGRGDGLRKVAGDAAICRELPPAVVHPAEHSD